MSFADLAAADRRLLILLALAEAPGYTLPPRLLQAFMGDKGQRASADQVRSDIAWLEEQGLLGLNGDAPTLSNRGIDVAADRARCPGVARPRPGDL